MTTKRPPINLDAPPNYHELALDRAYDRRSAMLETAPDPTDGAYERLVAARRREERHIAEAHERYRSLVVTVARAPIGRALLGAWKTDLIRTILDYCAAVEAIDVAETDANRARREMDGPATATRPDEVTQ